MICVKCGKGALQASATTESVTVDGVRLAVPGFEFSVCSQCGFEVVTPDQDRANGRRIADAKRTHWGLLKSDEIRAIRGLLCLSQREAGKLFGGGENAFDRYERGEVVQTRALDNLLRLVRNDPARLMELGREAAPLAMIRLSDHTVVAVVPPAAAARHNPWRQTSSPALEGAN